MDDLIARLEKATGRSDWNLDKEIAVLMREEIGDCADAEVPAYTSSIDAALTLVPLSDGNATHWGVELDRGFEAWVSRNNVSSGHWLQQGFAATPAIALCIAALKARSALSGG